MQVPFVFDVQRFSIHDGPGIRTVLFTKGCPLSCLWCQNPESQKAGAEVAFYAEQCTNCALCVQACAVGAIDAVSKISDYDSCTACGQCVDVCVNTARRMVGAARSVEELAGELLKDADFYESSGGGVTFSGGEPLMYPEFLLAIAKLLKAEGVSINVETSGRFNYDKAKELLALVDLVYFDIKHIDSDKHRAYTGVSNSTILRNFDNLSAELKELVPRVPLIPGFNDDVISLRQIASFLAERQYYSVHILPYHSMGNSKAIRIDHRKPEFKADIHEKAELKAVEDLFTQFNINAIIYE